MTNIILNPDGSYTVPTHVSSASAIIKRRVEEATVPAVKDKQGNEISPEIIPDASVVGAEMSIEAMKTNSLRLVKVREERMNDLFGDADENDKRHAGIRFLKLYKLDTEASNNLIGRPGFNKTPAEIEPDKQKLRDLPPIAQAALDVMTNTDDMEAYLPDELKE